MGLQAIRKNRGIKKKKGNFTHLYGLYPVSNSTINKNTGFNLMLSKNQAKFIQALHLKKNREKEGLFIAEGKKIVKEVLASGVRVRELFASEAFCTANESVIRSKGVKAHFITHDELKKISMLVNPDDALVVCEVPVRLPDPAQLGKDLALYLDGIRDPGNLGTIIRVCDWFGIKTVFCSHDSTEVYNPKTIQSSMGSFLRVNVFVSTLSELVEQVQQLGILCPVYGAFMAGENIYEMNEWKPGLLVIGNEAKGISEENSGLINQKLSIPAFSSPAPESLNAAIAASLLVAEYRRKKSFG